MVAELSSSALDSGFSRGSSRAMRAWAAARWILSALFLLSAGLQLNDPDPLRWIGVYGLAAIAMVFPEGSAAIACSRALLAVLCLGWAALLWNEVPAGASLAELFGPMESRGGRVELGREVGGLLVVGVSLAIAATVAWRKRSASS